MYLSIYIVNKISYNVDYKMRFYMASVIKQLREQNRYTQVQLAKILGVSRQALIKYENLEQEPPVSIIRALAKVFKVDYSYFIDNKIPEQIESKDEQNLIIIKNCFPLLKEEEKLAITEMIRLMAGK